jgi:hypothetical protein
MSEDVRLNTGRKASSKECSQSVSCEGIVTPPVSDNAGGLLSASIKLTTQALIGNFFPQASGNAASEEQRLLSFVDSNVKPALQTPNQVDERPPLPLFRTKKSKLPSAGSSSCSVASSSGVESLPSTAADDVFIADNSSLDSPGVAELQKKIADKCHDVQERSTSSAVSDGTVRHNLDSHYEKVQHGAVSRPAKIELRSIHYPANEVDSCSSVLSQQPAASKASVKQVASNFEPTQTEIKSSDQDVAVFAGNKDNLEVSFSGALDRTKILEANDGFKGTTGTERESITNSSFQADEEKLEGALSDLKMDLVNEFSELFKTWNVAGHKSDKEGVVQKRLSSKRPPVATLSEFDDDYNVLDMLDPDLFAPKWTSELSLASENTVFKIPSAPRSPQLPPKLCAGMFGQPVDEDDIGELL